MINIFEAVRSLDLPDGEYVIVGSGILGALGLREINDVDLVVSPKILAEFAEKEGWQSCERWGKTFLEKDDYEMFSQLSWEEYPTTREEAIKTAKYINSVPFLNIEETIKFKKALGRKKDARDIELLEKCLDSE